MDSERKVISYPNGEIQRVQLVRLDHWQQLDFFRPADSDAALSCFHHIYKAFLVPACPWIFGNMVMFRIPEDMETAFPFDTKKYGTCSDCLTAAAAALRTGVRIEAGKPVFRNDSVKAFWQELEKRNCLQIVSGKLPVTTIIPVRNCCGYLSETEPEALMKVNASFFIMDPFDCATVYDQVGTPLGLCVKNGIVQNPPLFNREALLVRESGVFIEPVDAKNLEIEIRGKHYIHGRNATLYSRPERATTPRRKGCKVVIVGCRVVAVSRKNVVSIPASGFVLCCDDPSDVMAGDAVVYRGMEDVLFGIQVGNSILRNGVKTEKFLSKFYNIRHLEPIPFPPSLYPMDYAKARAARIALGADNTGKPMLLWAEGAGKLSYTPGVDSRGASLLEMAEICSEMGMVHAVNLDGGGSAQILLKNHRSLLISDRNPKDNSEAERPIPLGLIVRGE